MSWRTIFMTVPALVILACAGGGEPSGTGGRTWRANVAIEPGYGLHDCTQSDSPKPIDRGATCIQRVQLANGQEMLEFSAVSCPSDTSKPLVASTSVVFSLTVVAFSSQDAQLYDRRGTSSGLRGDRAIGALGATTGQLRELCSETYFRDCTLQVSGGRWVNVGPWDSAQANCR